MSNIDPIYFLTPVVVLGFSLGLVVYWYARHRFTGGVLLYSFAAYFGAIVAKEVVQLATLRSFTAAIGGNPALLGTYYGGQTALFEVGGAFLVAGLAAANGRFTDRDAEGFGLGLGFWENAVLIALPLLFDYLVYYAVLSQPGSAAAQSLHSRLSQDAPALFYGPAAALPLVGLAILERVSSLLAHLAWGYLAVLGAIHRRWWYLAIAAPLGFLIDFLVPFAGALGEVRFELVVFLIALGGLALAVGVTRDLRRPGRGPSVPAGALGLSRP